MVGIVRRLAQRRVRRRTLAISTVCFASIIGCTAIASGEKLPEPKFETFASLAPSNTEQIYAIGAQDKLLGVSTQCDYPAAVSEKPKIGSFSSIDLEKVSLLHPQAVFLVGGQESQANILKNHGITPIVIHTGSVNEIGENTKRIGQLTHHAAQATAVSTAFERRVQVLRQAVSKTKNRPKVLLCVWPSPMVVAGPLSYLNDAITICGGINAAADLQGEYPHFNAERLLLSQPDVIILPHEAEKADLLKQQPWSSLAAVKNHKCYFLPKKEDDRLSRPTLRLYEGLVWLAKILHPEAKLEL